MDESLLLAINGLRAPWLDVIASPLSAHGYLAFPVLMLLALVEQRARALPAIRDGWLTWFLATFVTEQVLKPIIARPRPTAHEDLRRALHVLGTVPPPTSLSMPSGTATACFSGAVFIWLRWGRGPGIAACLLATLVSLSRVYVGVHWPSDIVVGALVGVVAALLLSRLAIRIDPSYRSKT